MVHSQRAAQPGSIARDPTARIIEVMSSLEPAQMCPAWLNGRAVLAVQSPQGSPQEGIRAQGGNARGRCAQWLLIPRFSLGATLIAELVDK